MLTWQATGATAVICPGSARFELFTVDDCCDVTLDGTLDFPTPALVTVQHTPLDFTLTVRGAGQTAVAQVEVAVRRHTPWFFAAELAAPGWALCPELNYDATFQCTLGYPSGGILWQDCYLRLPAETIAFFHPLGGWVPIALPPPAPPATAAPRAAKAAPPPRRAA